MPVSLVPVCMLNNSEFLFEFLEISRTVIPVDSKIEQQYEYCRFLNCELIVDVVVVVKYILVDAFAFSFVVYHNKM